MRTKQQSNSSTCVHLHENYALQQDEETLGFSWKMLVLFCFVFCFSPGFSLWFLLHEGEEERSGI